MPISTPFLSQSAFLEGLPIIGGVCAATTEQVIPVLNPATGETITVIPRLGASEAMRAIKYNVEALQSWRCLAAAERAGMLQAWRGLIIQSRDDLARLMTAEQGKPLSEARGEIDYAAGFVEWFAEEARRTYGEIIPSARDRRILVIKQPVGVVGAITPWNFPAAMITRKVAPALASGCTVTLKASELTPLTAFALARLALEAGIPPGVFNVIAGDAPEIGSVLTSHPDVAKFTFTGSTAVGKVLTAQCATTLKRVSMELGGNAPLIVFDDADLDVAVAGAITSKFRNTGQTCICANRILVQDGIHDRFAEALAARVAEFRVGNGLEGDTDQGPLITPAAYRKVRDHVDDAVRHGARVVTGGQHHDAGELFHQPTVLVGATEAMRLAGEETFGPVAPLFRFKSEAEALALANRTRSGLAAYAFTRDMDRFWRMAEALEFGMVAINTGVVSTETAPFGGIRESGLGREGSRHGIAEYLELKTISLGLSGQVQA
ncbi:NAD-dependent succinate-semialdehyde dehydrogenase [Novosphingobium sp. Gsoil 351]|uniref:NAD-dependent succinate-semialdehyde dehydrogenase n=1 Tax=Novosphingobium sp. Gsoil 351 TaxID=2675225 RepID=UPI0012B4C2E7|nr:NAD-dependent succinate-semialdehyde dehydrogenase [Novosphingobium sp. Gsoil 351]QGN54022.1 succinate-semialdehyde dehydrogenase [Novosphingobium sp. Gsoil 351]